MDYHLRSKKLTEIARNIFGEDIIDGVYVEYFDKKDIQNIKKDIESKNKNSENFISCDNKTVVVKFKNGNLISFTNSEWGSIAKVETLNLPN